MCEGHVIHGFIFPSAQLFGLLYHQLIDFLTIPAQTSDFYRQSTVESFEHFDRHRKL